MEIEEVKETPAIAKKKAKVSEYVALETKSVYCNKTFDLVKGKKLPKDFPKSFITSLISIKLIKEVK